MFKFMTLIMASQGQSHILLSWLNRTKLVRLMNGWIQLRRDLSSQLKADDDAVVQQTSSGARLQNYAVVSGGIIYLLINAICGCFLASLVPAHPDRSLELAFLTLTICFLGFSGTLLDVKVFLSFKELKTNFTQVCQ